jgi:uroporphyrinogen-III decarboxylase
MTAENQKRYDAKLRRINDAISLREPDMVPIKPPAELFPVYNAGYTVAEVIYDTTLTKMRSAIIKYLNDFDPDAAADTGFIFAGEGPGMEMSAPKNMRWAGMPGNIIDDNSLQQYIEFPVLLDDEFEDFFTDRTGFMMRKMAPRTSELLEPLAMLSAGGIFGSAQAVAAQFSAPDFRKMVETLWKLNDFYTEHRKRAAEVNAEIEQLGYPQLSGGMAGVPFDMYSDFLRGTLLSLADLYTNTEYVERYIDEDIEKTLAMIRATKGHSEGQHVFMALHKGMDGFMSDAHYRKYYWKHLQQIILAIIDSGKIPYIYTEGKYNSRLDCLSEVPPGKVFYHFEDVDMAVAKKKLGGIACIAGGFPAALLDWGTPAQVRDAARRMLDDCAPGGGFIFETGCGLGKCKRENVEAMFETVREYGKY